MRQELQAILDCALTAMCQEIDPDHGLRRKLLSEGVLRAEQIESCKARLTRAGRVEEMVCWLKLRDDSVYKKFRLILCQLNQQQFINEYLPSTEDAGISPKDCSPKHRMPHLWANVYGSRPYTRNASSVTIRVDQVQNKEKDSSPFYSTHCITMLNPFIESDYGLLDELYSNRVLTYGQYHTLRSMDDAEKRNECLLSVCSKHNYQLFLEALVQTDQQHVVNYIESISGSGDTLPLSTKFMSVIDANTYNLAANLDMSNGFLDLLLAKGTITHMQRYDVHDCPDKHHRNITLLNIMKRRSVIHFRQFLEVLKLTNQQHLLDGISAVEAQGGWQTPEIYSFWKEIEDSVQSEIVQPDGPRSKMDWHDPNATPMACPVY